MWTASERRGRDGIVDHDRSTIYPGAIAARILAYCASVRVSEIGEPCLLLGFAASCRRWRITWQFRAKSFHDAMDTYKYPDG